MIRRRTNESTTMMIFITSLISYCMLPAVTFAFISPSPQEGIASRRKWIATSALSTASSTALFGIKGFRSWFQDQFPNAVRNVDVDEHSDSFDHVLVDMNQILHVVLRRSRNRDQAMKSLMVELDILIGRCKPVQSLVLAIDGSPAAAKLATQRKRRFAILKNTQFKMENFDKLRMSKKKRAKRMRNYKAELQSLELTPGTECMRTMESALLYWSWQRLHSQGKSYSKLLPQVRIYISSSQVPGEGEIKLLEWINNYRGHLSNKPGQSIALIGGDADLSLEAMVIPPSWTHNVFVLRPEEPEQKGQNKNKSKESRIRHTTSTSPESNNNSNGNKHNGNSRRDTANMMHSTSLWEMTLSLDDYCRQNIPKTYYDPENNPKDLNLLLQIRTDMVLMFMLNGNDYLPRVVAAGFRGVLRTYLTLLERWIELKETNNDVGLVDPNTLQFRSSFCAEYFKILGRGAPSEEERLRNVRRTKRKTYHSILNDMSSIGFIPSPVRFQLAIDDDDDDDDDDDTNTLLGYINDNDDEDSDDEVEDLEDGDYDDDDEYDDDEDGDEDLNNDDEMDIMLLSLGQKDSDDYHEYRTQFNATAGKSNSKSYAKSKKRLARLALNDFELLDYIDTNGDITNTLYDWEIPYPAPANVDRYLAGLLWTLQTYQDGVCPSYGYNYGKCLAPTGNSIAAYFEKAVVEKRAVGLGELLPNMDPGGSIKAGVACLAALPVAVKNLVPRPYSLIDDETVEDFYSQCVDPVDNYFHFKEFENLVDIEVKKITKNNYTKTEDYWGGNFESGGSSQGRRIILGDHYWTVLKRVKEDIPYPFGPPPPPTEGFSQLRPNSRIAVNRVISIVHPYHRQSFKNVNSKDLKQRIPRSVREKHDIDIDHMNFESLINNSQSNSVLKIPYKIAFGSSLDHLKEKKEFKLLHSRPVSLHPFNQSGVKNREVIDNTDLELPIPMFNSQSQSALSILKQLCDAQLINDYKFNEDSNQNMTLTITMDDMNGSLPSKVYAFPWGKESSQSEQAVKQYLADLALNSMIHSRKDKSDQSQQQPPQWNDMTFQGMKEYIGVHYSGRVTNLNPENRTAVEILKQLRDIGTVRHYEFNEIPASSNHLETITLVVHKISTKMSPEETITFERIRTNESKKWIRQHLVSLALDKMIDSDYIVEKGGNTIRIKNWYDLSFVDTNSRIQYHQKYTKLVKK